MVLTVGVLDSDDSCTADYSAGCSLEDNGAFWFLYPYFEALAESTGQWIDLYETAQFHGNELSKLLETLRTVVGDVRDQPESWEVLTRWTEKDGRRDKETYDTVQRRELEQLLQNLIAMAEQAKRLGQGLIFYGD